MELLKAARNGDQDEIQKLLAAKADPNWQDAREKPRSCGLQHSGAKPSYPNW